MSDIQVIGRHYTPSIPKEGITPCKEEENLLIGFIIAFVKVDVKGVNMITDNILLDQCTFRNHSPKIMCLKNRKGYQHLR